MGHNAYTCDLLPSRDETTRHLQCDVWDVLEDGWDMAILHPPCTYLTTSAAWAYKDGPYHQPLKPSTLVGAERRQARDEAVKNFIKLMGLPMLLAIENPGRSFLASMYRKPDQLIQPYEFGDDASKLTGLWLKDLPKLVPTHRVKGRLVNGKERWSNQIDSGQCSAGSKTKNRSLRRSITYPGIAKAMAQQWGNNNANLRR